MWGKQRRDKDKEIARLLSRLYAIDWWYAHTHSDALGHCWHCNSRKTVRLGVSSACDCGWDMAEQALDETGPYAP